MTTSTECRLCRYAGGVCTTGYRKSHVRSDPACRLYKAIDKGTENVVAMSGRQKEPSQSSGGATPTSGTPKRGKAAPAKPNLDHMIIFRTGKKRLGLLFHPSLLDKGIGRKIQYEETTGKFRDEAGEYLNDEMAESYSNYWGRLCSRHELGKAADKLVCITDKYLPRITDETRAFIMRFPHRIPQLLKQARQVRSLARGGKTMPKSQTGRTLQSTTSTSKTATDEGEPASAQSVAGAASNPEPQDEQDQELTEPTRPPLAGDTAYHYVQPVPPDFEADVDWGRSDSEASSDRYTTTRAPEGELPRPEVGAMRPRTPSRSPRRQTSLGAQRPRTPSRSPRRQPVRLVPNQMWREVQQVQAHMARQRHTTELTK